MYVCVCLCPSWQKDYQAKGMCMWGTREASQRSGVFIHLYVLYLIVFCYKEMEDVADWLLTLGVWRTWVGASYKADDNIIKWRESDKIVAVSFWMSDVPANRLGDCVYMNTIPGIAPHLGMDACDNSMYFLCKVDIA